MKRIIFMGICMMLSAIAMCASEKDKSYQYYARGVFVSIDFAPGTALNGKRGNNEANSCYGTDLAIGYRIMPQLAVALGTGAHSFSNKTLTCDDTVRRKVENTSVPVYLRLRSDFFDREVSPYMQMDLGYSFMEMYTREDMGRVRYSDQAFSNGRHEYIEFNDSYIQYGMAGLCAALDFGVSLHVIGRCRMNIGLSAGVHQAFLGTSFQTTEGEVLNFGRIDYLNDGTGKSPLMVRTLGIADFWNSLEPSLKVKMGFTF